MDERAYGGLTITRPPETVFDRIQRLVPERNPLGARGANQKGRLQSGFFTRGKAAPLRRASCAHGTGTP